MRKILELGPQQFLTGISPSAHAQNKGLWADMRNATVVRDMSLGNDEAGLLQGSPNPSSSAALSDTPFAYARDVTSLANDKVYFLGSSGHLYEYDISGATATDKRSATPITDPANGLAVFQPRGGSKFLYYWQKDQIGRWDISGAYPTGWTDNWATDISTGTGTDWHPTHRLFDRIYYGNLDRIGYLADDGAAGVTHIKNGLDLPSDFRVNCLSDDGAYLVAGLSTNTSSVITYIGYSKVIFWDTTSSSWQREWDIPDAAILSIKKVDDHMEAVCSKGIYAFTFSTPPKLLLGPLQQEMAPDYDIPTQHAAAVLGSALLWASAPVGVTAGDLASLGKLTPQSPNAYLRPFGGLPTKPILIAPDIQANTIFIVCRATNTLYSIPTAGAGTNATSNAYASTIYIDLQRWWQIGRVVVEFENRIGVVDATDQIRISIKDEQDQAATTVGSVTGGSIRIKEFYKSIEARKAEIKIEFLGGSPKIRSLSLWGDPIELPTHSRA